MSDVAPSPPAALSPLEALLPPEGNVNAETLLEGFLSYCEGEGLELYSAQEEAILELFEGHNVILNTPTGSGKSLVALAAHWKAVAEGGRSFYTAPIKALVTEKFFDLCAKLGPANVGMMTGDASVNRDASVICCTAEILSNLALREGANADVDSVVMDEFHFYSDRDRGVAWQVPLLTLPHARFLLMSATLGATEFFRERIGELTDAPVALVKSDERPVPLDFEYAETPVHETLDELLKQGKAPVYVVHFAQRLAAEHAQDLMSVDVCTKEEKAAIKEELRGFAWDTPFGKDLRRFVHHGVGVHHAGMLPKYRRMVERLAQQGRLKILCGTDTLGVGVNVPIRSVLFTKLCKYDGEKTKVLSVRDFHQIAGRAGRRGFDARGSVIAQAPEHEIANLVARRKLEGDAKRMRKWKPKKPPERGYAHWDASTFERLIQGEPEALRSRFRVSHGMVLNVLEREAGCAALKGLLRSSHERPARQRQHGRHAIAILRSLIAADIVSLTPEGAIVNEDLQTDFSLNHALSLYVVEAAGALDPEDPDYALDVLSLVEATLEDPGAILYRQVDTLKRRALAGMKAAGVEYEERMEKLDQIDGPKPNSDFMRSTFATFAEHHPWVGSDSLRLKSVARDLFELGESFNGYVREYGLSRAEGVLLRYLTDAYKALVQTIPEALKTDALFELTDWLGVVVRRVDGSLLDEWETLRNPRSTADEASNAEGVESDDVDITRNAKHFRRLIRNAAFRIVQALARKDYARVVEGVTGSDAPNARGWERKMTPYWDEFDAILFDATARGAEHFVIDDSDIHKWHIFQTIVDPSMHLEWRLRFAIDLARCRDEGEVCLEWVGLDPS